jgi:2-methylcitrate dehydratase PrpD
MKDPRVLAVKKRIELVADRALMDPKAPRSGHVEVTLRDGRKVSHFTRHAPGTMENPLDADGVNAKVRDLMEPVIGPARTAQVIERVHALEGVRDVREFVRTLLAGPAR